MERKGKGHYILQGSPTMITCIHQRGNGMTNFDIPVHNSLLEIVCNRVRYGPTVFTDEYRAYDIGRTWIYTQKYQSFTERICKWYYPCQ
ncbi:hypothetical protein BH23THE1_BH23THE1_32560 [soil metagenome]